MGKPAIITADTAIGIDLATPPAAGAATDPACPRLEQAPPLPHRAMRVDRMAFRTIARWVDIGLAVWIALTCLSASGVSLVSVPLFVTLPYIAMPLVLRFGLNSVRAYQFSFGRSVMGHLARVTVAACLAMGASLAIGSWTSAQTPAPWLLIAAAAITVGAIAGHAIYLMVFRLLQHRGHFSETVVIIGATERAKTLITKNASTHALTIAGVFDDRLSRTPSDIAGVPVLGQIDDLLGWRDLPGVDRIIVAVNSKAHPRIKDLLIRLRPLPQDVALLLDLGPYEAETQSLYDIISSPAAKLSGSKVDPRRLVVKRAGDLLGAAALSIVFAPVMLIVAIAVALDSPGPILFRQKRHGFNNRVIRVWKFRSMTDDPAAERQITTQTAVDDPRVTRVGRFIRSTSLDELPQLLNVLMGEMSLVGPRPHALGMMTDNADAQAIVNDYAHRHRVKPGITGWAQINGSRGPVHTHADLRERVRLDMEYVNRASFWLDLYILVMTAPCLLGDAVRHR